MAVCDNIFSSLSTQIEDDSDSSGSESLSLDPRDILAKVNSLMEVFPDVTRERLEEAVKRAKGDVETATSFIIKLKIAEENS
jgi:CUE domain